MRKVFFLLLFLSFFGVSFAVTTEADMNNVGLRFCNDGLEKEKLKLNETVVVSPGQERDLCIYFFNKGGKKVVFKYGFAKGIIGPAGEHLCDSNIGTGNVFAKLFPSNVERVLTLESNTDKIISEKIFAPLGMSGMQYGCFVFSLLEPENKGVGGMFNLEIHRNTELNVFVGGSGTIKKSVLLNDVGNMFSINKKVGYIVSGNNLSLKFVVTNNGNISQNIVISGMLYNVLGFQRFFQSEVRKMAPNSQNEILVDLGIIPFYKGLFDVNFTMKADPVFDFDVSNIDKTLMDGIVINESGKFFVFSWIWPVLVVFVLFVLFRIFKKKKNNPVVIQS